MMSSPWLLQQCNLSELSKVRRVSEVESLVLLPCSMILVSSQMPPRP
jgi:hypothetical protein